MTCKESPGALSMLSSSCFQERARLKTPCFQSCSAEFETLLTCFQCLLHVLEKRRSARILIGLVCRKLRLTSYVLKALPRWSNCSETLVENATAECFCGPRRSLARTRIPNGRTDGTMPKDMDSASGIPPSFRNGRLLESDSPVHPRDQPGLPGRAAVPTSQRSLGSSELRWRGPK